MSDKTENVYRIKDWDQLQFEQHGNSRINGPMKWVAVPTKHDGKGYRRLMREDDGISIYGCWIVIVAVAAKCPVRGTLADEDGPLTAEEMSLKTDVPEDVIERSLAFLMTIKWIESVQYSHEMRQSPAIVRKIAQDRENMWPTEQDRTGHDKSCSGSGGSTALEGATAPPVRTGKKKSKKPSVFRNLTVEALGDMDKLADWHRWQAGSPEGLKPVLGSDQWPDCVAAALYAVEAGDNPVALFASIVGKGDYSKITNDVWRRAKEMIEP